MSVVRTLQGIHPREEKSLRVELLYSRGGTFYRFDRHLNFLPQKYQYSFFQMRGKSFGAKQVGWGGGGGVTRVRAQGRKMALRRNQVLREGHVSD